MAAQHPDRTGGLAMAVAAYTIWGFLPLYIALLRHVPAFELVAWRVIFTLPLCLAIAAWRGQMGDIRAAFGNPRVLVLLLLSSALIGFNWVVYIEAVNGGHVLAASLGYYINPLLNVALGTIFLGEKLNPARWAAVALAIVGVAVLALGALETLWISLALALSFALYGLVRKVAPVGSVPGLTIESAVLLLPAIAIATWFAGSPAGSSFGDDLENSLLLAGAGIATAVPLLCFALAARRLDLSTLGFVQFLAPTIVFVLGLTIFSEPMRTVQLASFVLIWVAIALFSWDLLRRRRAPSAEQAPA
jgi:chloramphenicol-sensitive protein RarD